MELCVNLLTSERYDVQQICNFSTDGYQYCIQYPVTWWKVHTFFGYQDQREWLLTFGLGIMILQGVSSRKSLAGVNIMDIMDRVSKKNSQLG
jgi:hypothetical protein